MTTTRPGPASDDVVAAIRELGPLAFSEYQWLALYGPNGFYQRGGGAGRRRDFLTSPEMGGLFASVIARYLDHVWTGLGRPERFVVVDAGAGPGALARGLARAASACRDHLELVLVEVSDELRSHHPVGPDLVSAPTLPPTAHVVVANELLDNLPVDIVERTADGWRQVMVDADPAGGQGLRFVPGPPALVEWAGSAWDVCGVGTRLPSAEAARRWVEDARSRLQPGGELVVFDYGVERTSELSRRPFLRTYRAHGRGTEVLHEPGSSDITCDVPFDQLPSPVETTTQAEFLNRHGIASIVDAGAQRWRAAAANPGIEDFLARSATVEAPGLLDPTGLGGFRVARWNREARPERGGLRR